MEFILAIAISAGLGHLVILLLYCALLCKKNGGCRVENTDTRQLTTESRASNASLSDGERGHMTTAVQSNTPETNDDQLVQSTVDQSQTFLTNTWVSTVISRIRNIRGRTATTNDTEQGRCELNMTHVHLESLPSYEDAIKNLDVVPDLPPSYEETMLDQPPDEQMNTMLYDM